LLELNLITAVNVTNIKLVNSEQILMMLSKMNPEFDEPELIPGL
jgi:hypothetical protein